MQAVDTGPGWTFMRVHDHLRYIPVIILTGGNLAVWGLQAYVVNKSEEWRPVQHYLRYLTSRR